MKRLFRIAAGLALVAAAGYFVFNRDKSFGYAFPFKKGEETLERLWQDIKKSGLDKKISDKTSAIAGKSRGIFTETTETIEEAIEKGKEKTGAAIEEAKQDTLQNFKEAVAEKMDSFGKGIGVNIQNNAAIDSNIILDASPVIFTVKVGAPAYFTLVNKEDGQLVYEVDWQDGGRDSGTLNSGEEIVVSHKWNKAGSYSAQFQINQKRKYPISINIVQ